MAKASTRTGPRAATCCAPVAIASELDADSVASVCAALASPLRLRILDVLRRSNTEVCQCELIAAFGIGQSLLSHHMRALVVAGLVHVERRHRWAWYSLRDEQFEGLRTWLR